MFRAARRARHLWENLVFVRKLDCEAAIALAIGWLVAVAATLI